MTGEPVRFPTRELIFNDLVLRGFWVDRWVRDASPADVAALNEKVWSLWRAGLPVGVEEVFPVEKIRDAVARAPRTRLRLERGETLIIDNGRVLHGRTAIRGTRRHLERHWISTRIPRQKENER